MLFTHTCSLSYEYFWWQHYIFKEKKKRKKTKKRQEDSEQTLNDFEAEMSQAPSDDFRLRHNDAGGDGDVPTHNKCEASKVETTNISEEKSEANFLNDAAAVTVSAVEINEDVKNKTLETLEHKFKEIQTSLVKDATHNETVRSSPAAVAASSSLSTTQVKSQSHNDE